MIYRCFSDCEVDDELTLTAVGDAFPELDDTGSIHEPAKRVSKPMVDAASSAPEHKLSTNEKSTGHVDIDGLTTVDPAPAVVPAPTGHRPTPTGHPAPAVDPAPSVDPAPTGHPAPTDPKPGTSTEGNEVETGTLAERLKEAFDGLAGVKNDGFLVMTEKARVVVTMDRLLDLFGGECDRQGCNKVKEVRQKCEGGVVVVSWSCGVGHSGQWESSDVLCQKGRGQRVYVNTVLLAASVLVSGNNFDKVSVLSKCLNLNFVSKSTYQRIQKLYAVPAIGAMWEEMKEVMEKVFKGESMILAGDGRNDSPGYCAQYCVYSVMAELTKVIVDVEVKDKRETGGSSPAMEVAALKVILERLVGKFKLGEFTTDASNSVISLIKKLKGIILNFVMYVLLFILPTFQDLVIQLNCTHSNILLVVTLYFPANSK